MATLRDLRPGDIGWILQQHGEYYVLEHGFSPDFEALVAEILAGFLRNVDPASDRGWIVEADGARMGCVFCVREDATTAKLRLFYLVPDARSRGVGRQLLYALTEFARSAGYARIRLATHAEHAAACRLYRREGFVCLSSRPVHSFGRDLTEQIWEKPLK